MGKSHQIRKSTEGQNTVILPIHYSYTLNDCIEILNRNISKLNNNKK